MFGRSATVNQNLLERVVLAQKVGAYLTSDHVPRDQRRKVENFALMLAHDVSEEVRQCLAFELRRAPDLPRSLVMLIVRDIESVCEPFIRSTEIFTDEQWIEILDDLEEHALAALARRPAVSEPMSFALVQAGGERTVSGLMNNRGAEMSERVCDTVMDRFDRHDGILKAMADRGDLPMTVVHKLVTYLAEGAARALVAAYGLAPDTAEAVTVAAADRATVQHLASLKKTALMEQMREMRSQSQLTDGLILAAAAAEQWKIAASALSLRAALPLTAVETVLASGSESRIDRLLHDANVAPGIVIGLRRELIGYPG